MLKKCAVINDLSGFGKCSLGVALPIISVMGSEVHPFPTAVLSNQTAYDSYIQIDLTKHMNDYISEWLKLNTHFDAVLTGFVTNEKQLDVINEFVDVFKDSDTLLIVDPVMADNGRLYNGYTPEMCEKIKLLCRRADIITPNIAELAYIAEEPYSEAFDDICRYGRRLIDKGIKKVVVTGYKEKDSISNIVFDGDMIDTFSSKLIGGYYSGTGDIIASIITGAILKGMTLQEAVRLATDFISKVIENTHTDNANAGIDFEQYLGELI